MFLWKSVTLTIEKGTQNNARVLFCGQNGDIIAHVSANIEGR